MNKIVIVAAGKSWIFESAGSAVSLPAPLSITVHPNGGTVTVETMTASGGEWVPVASGGLAGDLSAPVSDVLTGTLYAVQFSASGAPATIELAW